MGIGPDPRGLVFEVVRDALRQFSGLPYSDVIREADGRPCRRHTAGPDQACEPARR